jgi:hypothetical protein
MAETDNTQAESGWMWLDEFFRRCRTEVQSEKGGIRIARRRLHYREVRYRYIDGAGKGRENDFKYWLTATINEKERSAIQHCDPNYDFFREAGRRSIFEGRPSELGKHRHRGLPGMYQPRGPLAEAYKIEIEVPRQEETEERPPEAPKAEAPPEENLTAITPLAAPISDQSPAPAVLIDDIVSQEQATSRRGPRSSAKLILAEAERRLRSPDRLTYVQVGRKRFLDGLETWLQKTHRSAKPMRSKTIGDHLSRNARIRGC